MAAGDKAEATILHILEAANRSEGKLRKDNRSAVTEDGMYQRLKGYGQAFLVEPKCCVQMLCPKREAALVATAAAAAASVLEKKIVMKKIF